MGTDVVVAHFPQPLTRNRLRLFVQILVKEMNLSRDLLVRREARNPVKFPRLERPPVIDVPVPGLPDLQDGTGDLEEIALHIDEQLLIERVAEPVHEVAGERVLVNARLAKGRVDREQLVPHQSPIDLLRIDLGQRRIRLRAKERRPEVAELVHVSDRLSRAVNRFERDVLAQAEMSNQVNAVRGALPEAGDEVVDVPRVGSASGDLVGQGRPAALQADDDQGSERILDRFGNEREPLVHLDHLVERAHVGPRVRELRFGWVNEPWNRLLYLT